MAELDSGDGDEGSCDQQRPSHERLGSHGKDTGFNSECLGEFYAVELHDLMYMRHAGSRVVTVVVNNRAGR